MLTIEPVISTVSLTSATVPIRLPSKSQVTVIAERSIETDTETPFVSYRARIVLNFYGTSADYYATFNVAVGADSRALFEALQPNRHDRAVAILRAVYASCDGATGNEAWHASEWSSLLFTELAHELGFDANAARNGFIRERVTK